MRSYRAWALVVICACGGGGAATEASMDAGAKSAPSAPSDAGPPSSPAPNPYASDAAPSAANDAAPSDAGVTRATPPPLPQYSHGTCPKLVGGFDQASSTITDFPTGSQLRQFHLVVPPSYDGSQAWPVVFAWHWLNADANSFINQGQLLTATEQMHFLAVVPDKLRNDAGNKVYELDWPFVETWGAASELEFFDDMLACVAANYKVDPARVYAIGVSAGALWATYVSTTPRVQHLAAVESLSGGLGADPTGTWAMQYQPQPNKFPALVLWGGPNDWFILNFQQASEKYRDALRGDHHFVVECTHDAGHAMPPVPQPPDGGTHFEMLWRFMLDHPYGLPPGTSPYQESGLPSSFPSWCRLAP